MFTPPHIGCVLNPMALKLSTGNSKPPIEKRGDDAIMTLLGALRKVHDASAYIRMPGRYTHAMLLAARDGTQVVGKRNPVVQRTLS